MVISVRLRCLDLRLDLSKILAGQELRSGTERGWAGVMRKTNQVASDGMWRQALKAGTAGMVALSFLLVGTAFATPIPIDLSPLASAALNPTNYALGDHRLGITAPNAVAQPPSAATGGEIAGGIVFDDVSKLLTWNIGYGSDFGFIDLVGNFSVAHIHGPVAVQFPAANTGAGISIPLAHTPGSSANTGSFIGSTTLTAGQESDLLNNLLYINIHSSFEPGGEIRGQLVPVVPEPSTLGLALIGLVLLRRRNRG